MAINKTGRSTRQAAITRDKHDLYTRYVLRFGRLTEQVWVCLQISTLKHFGKSQLGNLLWCSGRYLLTDSLKRRHVVHKSGAGVGSGSVRRGRYRLGGSYRHRVRRQQALSGSVVVAPSLPLYLRRSTVSYLAPGHLNLLHYPLYRYLLSYNTIHISMNDVHLLYIIYSERYN